MEWPFFLIGFATGIIGTIVGAGGGFLVMPILLLLYQVEPIYAAGTSLFMVVLNGLAGTVSYLRRGKVDIKNGLQFTSIAFIGVLLGIYFTLLIDPHTFRVLFGVLVIGLACWMIIRQPMDGCAEASFSFGWQELSVARRVGAFVLLIAIGVISSLTGIGGGPFLVPFLVYLLGYPLKLGVATSQFVVTCLALLSFAFYASHGFVVWPEGIGLGIGAIVGAPLGVYMSRLISSRHLVYLLSSLLFLTGFRLFYQ
ncbi:sulfite exporter TauE/SafE family protein [Brevibacillus humidisoli]|uniref:sulfite exporter TauE/SafE family protein n=1 Tax=Brevibacillus humidisoli TaxID=2895522 RepID=UPI001E360E6D|nr:sulfite exporter TauE/SafE family protein [Brevibacillus humidisoli]UFJ38920.1 sulfite exporter TauE/SafE family protein [Brevibacillus humidisoli]